MNLITPRSKPLHPLYILESPPPVDRVDFESAQTDYHDDMLPRAFKF